MSAVDGKDGRIFSVVALAALQSHKTGKAAEMKCA